MSATFSANGAAVGMPVGATASSAVAATGSSAAPLVLALPTILASSFAPFSQELYHSQRVFALDGMASTTATIKTGPVVDVLLQIAAVSEALPGAEPWWRHRSVEGGIRQIICGISTRTGPGRKV